MVKTIRQVALLWPISHPARPLLWSCHPWVMFCSPVTRVFVSPFAVGRNGKAPAEFFDHLSPRRPQDRKPAALALRTYCLYPCCFFPALTPFFRSFNTDLNLAAMRLTVSNCHKSYFTMILALKKDKSVNIGHFCTILVL